MGFLGAVWTKDVRRILRDPASLALWVGIPIAIGTMITLATGGQSGPKPVAELLLADEDGSFVSSLLAGAFANMDGLVQVEPVTREEGRARLDDGEGSALLVVPEGFGTAVLEETPAELLLVTNPAQRILPGILEEGARVLVDGVFYLHRVLGDELRTMVKGPAEGRRFFADADIAQLSVDIQHAVQRLDKYLFPPVIDVTFGVAGAADEAPADPVSFAFLFVPGILIMAFFFTSQGLADDLWAERQQGTLRRVLTTPRHLFAFLGGKLLAGGAVLAAVSLVVLVVGMLYHGVTLARLPLALGWSVLTAGVLLLLMDLVNLWCTTRRGAQLVSSSLTFPLLMLGGSFFPSESMPGWMARVGGLTPNGWALELLKDILLDRVAAGALVRGVAVALAAVVVLLFLCSWRVRATLMGGRS